MSYNGRSFMDLEPIRQRWLKRNPSAAHGLGIHDYDGELPDLSHKGVQQMIADIKADLAELDAMVVPDDEVEQFNYNLVHSQLTTDLWSLEVRQEQLDNPTTYSFTLMAPEGSYTIRNFASIEERVRIIIQFSRNLEKWFADARQNLSGALASPKIEMALNVSRGARSYFADELINFIMKCENESLIQEWSEVNIRVLEIIDDWIAFLESKKEDAHNDYALGEDKFLEYLRMTEGVDIDAGRLLEIGEADLKRNYDQFCDIARREGFDDPIQLKEEIYKHLPTADNLLEKTAELTRRTKQFLLKSDIVTIPSEDEPKVIATPKSFRKFAFAAMNTPGPFDPPSAQQSYYYVTPPEPEWSEERTKEFLTMFAQPVNEIIAVHEAFPGHYLQLLYSNTSTNKIALTFAYSYAMIEGWGHYSEQMVIEEGYSQMLGENEDPDLLHAGQLIEALIRNVRYVVAVRMHCQGMTMEEAEKLFMEKAFMPKQNAAIEAHRGTVDPLYLNYTLGKLMIYKLREDYKQERGDAYSLKKFHDTMLSYGSPNIAVLRKAILKEDHGSVI